MKRYLVALSAVALSVGGTQAADLILQQPVFDEVMYATELPAEYYFSVEALALWRSSNDTVLWQDGVTADFFSTRDLTDPGMGLGARFALGGPIADEFGWQIAGFWAGNFSSNGTWITDTEDINAVYDNDVTPGTLHFANSDDAFALTFDESASVGGLEANATFGDQQLRFLVGPRFIRYQSSLGTVVYDEIGDFEGTDDDIDRVDIESVNNLMGVQFGVEGMVPLFDSMSIGGRATVGLYANHATLDRSYSADDGSSPFATDSVSAGSSATGFAQSLELSPKLSMAVNENIDVSLGAMLLFLNGVDEPGDHFAGIGEDDGSGDLANDDPDFDNGVHFAGLTLGVHGRF